VRILVCLDHALLLFSREGIEVFVVVKVGHA
jgi:hypothetical protein